MSDDYEDSGDDYCRECGGECESPDGHGIESDDDDLSEFADPGGESALRAETESNPRNLPCPNCHAPNQLTPKDQALGYQCDGCANAAERGVDRTYDCGGPGKCELCGPAEDGEEGGG